MSSAHWTGLYRQALDRARSRSASASIARDLIACGLTNNVDLVVSLTSELLLALIAEAPVPNLPAARQTRASTPTELLTAIVQCIDAGDGIDLPVSRDVQDWLIARAPGRRQLGGTGAQAANTLGRLGFPTLIHLTSCSPEQADAFSRPDLALVACRDGALVPMVDRIDSNEPTMLHVALEYEAGLTAMVNGVDVVAPEANRVIVSHDPVNAAFEINQAFVEAVADPELAIRRVLLSGYSQITSPQALQRLLGQTTAATNHWLAQRPDCFIHAELGAMPRPDDLAHVVETIGLAVTSIGMNVDEMRDLTGVWGMRKLDGARRLRETMESVRHRAWSSRLNLHASDYTVSLTNGLPETERDALLFGSLVAASRARIGTYPSFDDLDVTLSTCEPSPTGLALIEELGLPDGFDRGGKECFVIVPALYVPRPVAEVGLGDSFTAGVLAMV